MATAGGIALFLAVVVALHFVQPDYDPSTQFMSELALGPFGGSLLAAFLGLAVAIAATAANLRIHDAPAAVTALSYMAAAAFLGAGLVTLDVSAHLHTLLVAAAFVLCGLGMYLLPATMSAFATPCHRLASWSCLAAMAFSTALGGDAIPPGIAQRLAAAVLMAWLALVAWKLFRRTPDPRRWPPR